MRAPLKFRIRVEGTRFIRVHITESREKMWRELEKCHGERHRHEYAATVYFPGAPDKGCIADIFFYFRGLRPSIIAHEAAHAAWAVAAALGKNVDLADNEVFAEWTEKITEKIWIKTQTAPL